MNAYSKDTLVRAENVVARYMEEQHRWRNEEYDILLYQTDPSSPVVTFMAFHHDDKNPAGPGGGKSLLIQVDMEKMTVVRSLAFQ